MQAKFYFHITSFQNIVNSLEPVPTKDMEQCKISMWQYMAFTDNLYLGMEIVSFKQSAIAYMDIKTIICTSDI